MNTFTVSFFGHRIIENALKIEGRLEQLIQALLRDHEYVEFLVGRDGEFDQLVSSAIRRCKREYRSDNSAHIWMLPYITAEFRDNEESFRDYYDEIEVCEAAAGSHFKAAFQARNRAMVNRSHLVVFCIDHHSGGMADLSVRTAAGHPLYQSTHRSIGGIGMKYVLSAIGGAVAMFLALVCIANFTDREKTANYEHIDYISAIQQEDCYLCGDGADSLAAAYWGQDNVGILNLNTFEVLRLEINRYDDHGELITTQAGIMQSTGIQNVHAYVHPDRGYANVQISGVEYDTDRDSVQNRLCQNCLDTLNGEWYGDEPPTEFAVVNFADKTVEAMMPSKTGFGSGNYYVDCEYNDNGKIDLLIFYCPPRYQ